MVLDPLKEGFDLASTLIELSNCHRRKREVVG